MRFGPRRSSVLTCQNVYAPLCNLMLFFPPHLCCCVTPCLITTIANSCIRTEMQAWLLFGDEAALLECKSRHEHQEKLRFFFSLKKIKLIFRFLELEKIGYSKFKFYNASFILKKSKKWMFQPNNCLRYASFLTQRIQESSEQTTMAKTLKYVEYWGGEESW